MYSYRCIDCGNTTDFIPNGNGFYCRDCGGVNVELTSPAPYNAKFAPGLWLTDAGQIAELERMHMLQDRRPAKGTFFDKAA